VIIVTGGAGFIGSNLVHALNKKGCDDIVIVDNLSNPEKFNNIKNFSISDYFDKNDFIENLESIKKPEAIFHLGACTSTTEKDGLYLMRNNFEYSKKLLQWAMSRRVPFVYASSASVYGNGSDGFKEDRSCENPLNMYAFSKMMFDNYVRRVIHKSPVPLTGVRFFNVYGPQENHKGGMASVIFQFYHQLKKYGEMRLFEGSKEFLRDFVFVDDVVKVILFLYSGEKKGIFNCGTGRARSFYDIAAIMKKGSKPARITIVPFPVELKCKYQSYTCSDPGNLIRAGYKNKFTEIEEGVIKYHHLLESTGGYLEKIPRHH